MAHAYFADYESFLGVCNFAGQEFDDYLVPEGPNSFFKVISRKALKLILYEN